MIVAAKGKIVSIFELMCGPVQDILNELGADICNKELFYIKLLNRITDNKFNIKADDIYVDFVNVGSIECLQIDYVKSNCQFILFVKNNFNSDDRNLIQYFVENSVFDFENKYIIGVTKTNRDIEFVTYTNDICFKSMGLGGLRKIKKSVERQEFVENQLLPELNKYINNYTAIQKVLGKLNKNSQDEQNIYSGFIDYLKYVNTVDED